MIPSLQQPPETHPTTPPEDPTLPPVDAPRIAAPASSGPAWSPFLRLLGVVLALGAGIGDIYAVSAMLWSGSGAPVPGWLFPVGLVGCVVVAAVAAALLRSWWAALIVPVAVYVGAHLGLLIHYGFNFQQWVSAVVTFSFIVVVFAVLPAIVGALIGVPIGKWVERRIRR